MEFELQYTLAQIGITIMGFSGLIVVFRPEGMRNWKRSELTALWILTSNGLVITLFAILPVLLFLAEIPNFWAVSQIALGTYLVLLSAATIWGSLSAGFFADENRVAVISHLLIIFTCFTPFLAIILVVTGFTDILWRTQWFYSGALLAGVVVAGLEFLYFVALMVRGRADLEERNAA